MQQKKLKNYQDVSLKTASPEEILLKLYEAAIKSTKKAIHAIEKGDLKTKGEKISHLQAIIIELHTSLDFEKGGEIAKNLSSLYDFIIRHITKANLEINAEPLKDVLKILNNLYSGWVQAVKKTKNG